VSRGEQESSQDYHDDPEADEDFAEVVHRPTFTNSAPSGAEAR
jgi:hypothetical protein